MLPNSRTYRVTQNKVLSPEQCLALQGIFKSDFPALATWAKEKKVITRSFAGNAFSTTVCMAVALVALCHGPLPRTSSLKRMAPREGEEEEEKQAVQHPRTAKRAKEEPVEEPLEEPAEEAAVDRSVMTTDGPVEAAARVEV